MDKRSFFGEKRIFRLADQKRNVVRKDSCQIDRLIEGRLHS